MYGEEKYFVFFPISEHLFEYIGTQFPPTFRYTVREDKFDYSVFSNGYIRNDTTFYALGRKNILYWPTRAAKPVQKSLGPARQSQRTKQESIVTCYFSH